MVALDVAVVGGGIQGLVLLRELTAAGYGSVLVTQGDLGSGQTLHSHGLLNSGTGLMTGVLAEELHQLTLPYLRRLGVPSYGEDRSFLLAPDSMVDQLAPAWEANEYHPQRIDPSGLPTGIEPPAPAYRVRAFNVDKRRLVAALSAGMEPLILVGDVVDAGDALRVRVKASGDVVPLEARAVVVAAGCGTKALLRDGFGTHGVVLDRITYTKPHMICVRGPVEALPDIGTVISAGMIVVGHPSPAASASGGRLVTWYVTPASPPPPPRYADAPDDGVAEIDAVMVTAGIESLLGLVPSLAANDERIQATVFAGYKQDFDGESTRRACVLVDGERNILMALPSVLANAVPNAVETLGMIRERVGAASGPPGVRWGAGVAVGRLNEDAGAGRWTDWGDFAGRYGVRIG